MAYYELRDRGSLNSTALYNGGMIVMPLSGTEELKLTSVNLPNSMYMYYKSRYALMYPTEGTTTRTNGPVTGYRNYQEKGARPVNTTIALIQDNSDLYDYLSSDIGATLVEAKSVSGRYRVLSQGAVNGYPSTFTLGSRDTYQTVAFHYPIHKVFINNVLYDWISARYTANAGNYDNFTLSMSTEIQLTSSTAYLYGAQVDETDLTSMSINVGDVIDFGPFPVPILEGWYNWIQDNTEQLYEYNYTIFSSDGSTERANISEAPGMSSARITYVGDTKALTLTGVNGREYAVSWSSPTPSGKVFLGLAYEPNSKVAAISAGTETPVTWDSSVSLYEVYGTYRPPATPFDINLYRSTAEPNRVDKTDYLSSYGTLSGTLRNECSIIRPSITFRYDGVPLFNYVYIAPFRRWYFVTAMTSVSNDIWRMDLNCDVLYSFKDEIRALWAIIARQEYDYSLMMNDPDIAAISERTFTVIPSSLSPIDQSTVLNSYVLTVVGRGGG